MKQLCWPVVLIAGLGSSVRAEDWPQFRGPGGQGHSAERDVPLRWSESENVRWKTPVPGHGWSSPVIRGNEIWLTTATDDGRSLRAIRLDRESGRIVRDVEVVRRDDPDKIHNKNSHASPTPILDGDRVFVHFGPNGTACLANDGKILWKTAVAYDPMHGPGGSPTLADDLLIMSCDGLEHQFVVALDKQTGNVRWKRDRGAGAHSYSTPLVIDVAGTPQLISTGGNRVSAYDPRSGDELWHSTYDGYSLVPRPVFGRGLVFITTGYNNPEMHAIRPNGRGDVTATHVAWTLKQSAPHNPSPLLVGDELYIVSDNGIATCLDAATGRVHWRQRLGGSFSASPLSADGRIYFLNESGEATVIEPGMQFKELAKNKLDGRTLASPAISGHAIFLRTNSHLYRIEQN